MDTIRTDYGLFYPSDYGKVRDALGWVKERTLSLMRPISFLDLGAGLGGVVSDARGMGFDAHGIEASEILCTSAVTTYVMRGDFLNPDFKLSGYDVLYYFLDGCNREPDLFRKIKEQASNWVMLSAFTLPPEKLEAAIAEIGLDVRVRFENIVIGVIREETDDAA